MLFGINNYFIFAGICGLIAMILFIVHNELKESGQLETSAAIFLGGCFGFLVVAFWPIVLMLLGVVGSIFIIGYGIISITRLIVNNLKKRNIDNV